MRLTADNKMVFELTSEQEIPLPVVINPSYIYKVGDRITVYDLLPKDEDGSDNMMCILEVTDVKHELHCHIDGDQWIIVYVEEIKEEK